MNWTSLNSWEYFPLYHSTDKHTHTQIRSVSCFSAKSIFFFCFCSFSRSWCFLYFFLLFCMLYFFEKSLLVVFSLLVYTFSSIFLCLFCRAFRNIPFVFFIFVLIFLCLLWCFFFFCFFLCLHVGSLLRIDFSLCAFFEAKLSDVSFWGTTK